MISDLGLIDAPLRPYNRSEKSIEVTNPATGDTLGTVPSLDSDAIISAIDMADNGFRLWRMLTAKERSEKLRAWANLMRERCETLAELLTSEQGKPLAEARGEVSYAAGFLDWFAEEGRRAYGETIPSHASGMRVHTIRQPIGVVAAITPWNFPLAMITRKAGAALAAGCSIVLKPADQTPFSALALQKLAVEAGIPGDAFIVVTGDAALIGSVLTRDPRIRKLSFTGSTAVGKLLYRQSSDTLKKLSLELGGNAPFIVFSDADIDLAADAAIASKFRNAGQTCVCANRFYVQGDVYDAFALAFAKRVAGLNVGDGTKPGSDIGPLIDRAAFVSVSKKVEEAKRSGADVIIGGGQDPAGALFYQPTVLVNVAHDSAVVSDEIFGPVAPLIRFSNEADLIDIANDSPYGLASYVFTENIRRAHRVSEALECGMVGINTGMISTEVGPFGGVKHSGLGREGGWQGLDDYLETKLIVTGV